MIFLCPPIYVYVCVCFGHDISLPTYICMCVPVWARSTSVHVHLYMYICMQSYLTWANSPTAFVPYGRAMPAAAAVGCEDTAPRIGGEAGQQRLFDCCLDLQE